MSDQRMPEAVRGIPHVEQYLGPWAMHVPAFEQTWDMVRSIDLAAHRAQSDGDGRPAAAVEMTDDGIAVIEMIGTFTKYGSSFSENPGTLALRQAVRRAAADPQVRAIMLLIDSPGGSTAGISDLGEDVAAAAARKPTAAYIEDLGASAAYWIASQAGRVTANAGALVGSIGVYAVIQDLSGMAEREGVKVHVVRAGAMKGAGTPGTEVTDEQLADVQRVVDQLNELFLATVARGRGVERAAVEAWADGRVHIAEEARKLGLLDAAGSWADALAELRGRIPVVGAKNTAGGARSTKEKTAMAENDTVVALSTETRAATLAELKRELPESDAAFREECLELEATLADAQKLWIDRQNKALAAAQAAQTAQAAEIERLKATRMGVEPLGTQAPASGAAAGSDPVAEWNRRVAGFEANGVGRSDAVRRVAREDPELREAYVEAANSR
jgi:signal peptide peptidase SppA